MNKIYLIEGAVHTHYSYDALITNIKDQVLVLTLNSKKSHLNDVLANYLRRLAWNHPLFEAKREAKHEVKLEDLPLFLYMEWKSPEFLDLLKRGLQ
jgi:hypothetical protein